VALRYRQALQVTIIETHTLNGNGASPAGLATPVGLAARSQQPASLRGPVGFAIVGCGYWGVNYIRVLRELAGARVVAVCDQRIGRLREIESVYPDVRLTVDVHDALATPGVDAAVVCTEARSHTVVASACLDAGKHVLVEKPLATSAHEAEGLTELAASSGLVLMVGHTFLYNDGVRKVKEYIDEKRLGDIYYLYARRTNLGPIRHDVNAIWDLASHDVSICNYLLDSVPEWVSAVGARVLRNGREDVGFVSLSYPGGILAHLHASWADPNKVREVVVVGSESRVVFNDVDAVERVRVFEKGVTAPANGTVPSFGEHQLLIRDGDIISPKLDVSEPLKVQSSHFLDCIAGAAKPLTNGRLGRDVVRVMEAIDRSMRNLGAPAVVL
jgi:predicted dehydrogenase